MWMVPVIGVRLIEVQLCLMEEGTGTITTIAIQQVFVVVCLVANLDPQDSQGRVFTPTVRNVNWF